MYVNWLPVPCRKGYRQQPSVVPLLVPLLYSALRASFSQQCYASARFLLLVQIVPKCPASLPLYIVTYILFTFHSALAVLTAFSPALLLCITFSSAVPISVCLSFFPTLYFSPWLSLTVKISLSLPRLLCPPTHSAETQMTFQGWGWDWKVVPGCSVLADNEWACQIWYMWTARKNGALGALCERKRVGQRGREGVRERERSHLCIVTADFTLTLSLLYPVEQEGAPGGTFTKWGNTHLHTHTYSLYCTYTHSDTFVNTDISLQNTHVPPRTYSEKLLVDTFRHTQSHLRPKRTVYRITATEWLFGLFDLGMMSALIRLL